MRYVSGDSSVKARKVWVDLKKGKRWRRKMADDELEALAVFTVFSVCGVVIIVLTIFQ
jgi:hypothetical protein